MRPDARLVRNLRSLLGVAQAMGGAVDLDSLLEVILSGARDVMEAERSSLFILDEATRTLWNRTSESLARGQVRVPLGVGIVGHVARTGELLSIRDAYLDPRFNREVDLTTGFRTRSILSAPLHAQSGRLIGVNQVLNKRGDAGFDRDDEELARAFASHAAVALDRARLVAAALEKQRIEEGLRLAQQIQNAMLPRAFPREPTFELAAEVRPARSVGGDLYDFLIEDDRLWFLVGDVSGKGVAAALFMAVAKTLLRASLPGASSPGAVLGRVNRELCRDNDQAMFATAFLGHLDLRSGGLLIGNAGHNPPYRLGLGGEVTPLAVPSGVPLGVLEGCEFQTSEARLEAGEALYVYTDGVTEALDETAEPFSAQRLEAFLRGARAAPAAELVCGSLAAVRAFVGEQPPSDDITVLAVRYLAPPEGGSARRDPPCATELAEP